ncbi:hypothetical protein QWY16_06695 [Planococcus shenhongbingii]|uniref:hypothetical protein n=1 Tax=Planococcus shenhongbingii TaxID=3058398 RepID=UPI00260DD22C|nr:hypothetical protein [Planococcus sp. N016]WKA59790.1 hypothetical protein QWY16_06695 [Planococcus sp. N016]
MSTLIALSPLLLWIVLVLIIGAVLVMVKRKSTPQKSLEARIAVLEEEVRRLKSKE